MKQDSQASLASLDLIFVEIDRHLRAQAEREAFAEAKDRATRMALQMAREDGWVQRAGLSS